MAKSYDVRVIRGSSGAVEQMQKHGKSHKGKKRPDKKDNKK